MAIMNRMRQNTKSILLILVVAFMLTIIIDWGMGGFKGAVDPTVIANVDGEKISREAFYNQYQQELAAQREQTGQEPSQYEAQNIENQVFERMVQQVLLTKAIDKMGLTVSTEEIMEELWNNPPQFLRTNQAFQDSLGRFDQARYEAALNNPAADQFWNSVISYMESSLPIQKLSNLLDLSTVVTDEDAKLEFIKNNVRTKVNFLYYDAASFNDRIAEPTDDEIQIYYNDHKDDFLQQEQRVLNYILLEMKATADDSANVLEQAQDLLKDINDGQDFAELAKLYSQDEGTADNGGDLGFFTKEKMVTPFSDAAFGAKVGQVVGPVETRFGLHIIKVEERKREAGELQVKARHILLKYEASPSTREGVADIANYIAEYAKEQDFADLVSSEGLELRNTPPFIEGNYVPGIGMNARINRFAFRSKVGDVSPVVYTDQGYVVASVDSIAAEHTKPVNDVKAQIVNILKAEKRIEAAGMVAKVAAEKLAGGSDIETVAANDSITVQKTDFFTISRPAPKLGNEFEVLGSIMNLGVGEFTGAVKGSRGYFIVQLVEKEGFDQEEFEGQKESLKLQLAARQRTQAFGLWYQKIKDDAKIEDFRGEFM